MLSDVKKPLLISLLACALLMIAGAASAETQMMVLLDASGSMAAPGRAGTSNTRFDEVKTALNALLQNLPADVAVGLRVMGGSGAADCYTTYLYFPPATGIRSQFQDFVDTIHPAGTRALYQGVEDALGDTAGSARGAERIILVITGGGDECGRDFTTLAATYAWATDVPRVVIYGMNMSTSEKESIGEFAAETGGRLIDIGTTMDLAAALETFAQEFTNNLRIHLQDTSGNAVSGDVLVRDVRTDTVIEERLDTSDLAIDVEPGEYEVVGRYLGEEVRSDRFLIGEDGGKTVVLEFSVYREPFTLMLRDLYDQPLMARVTFVNTNGDAVYTTEVGAVHRVELPADSYTLQIRVGDFYQEISGVQVGPGLENTYEAELPIELGTLEVEVANVYGFPLNAAVSIYDSEGTLIDEAPSTSYLYSRLPPGQYRILAEYEDIQSEETVYLSPGEQMQVGLEIDIALGDIFIMLRTDSGNDVWGWVRVYDSMGNLLERFDRERIESPDWYLTDVPVGIYRIEAEADGIVRVISGVEVNENEETEVTVYFPDETG